MNIVSTVNPERHYPLYETEVRAVELNGLGDAVAITNSLSELIGAERSERIRQLPDLPDNLIFNEFKKPLWFGNYQGTRPIHTYESVRRELLAQIEQGLFSPDEPFSVIARDAQHADILARAVRHLTGEERPLDPFDPWARAIALGKAVLEGNTDSGDSIYINAVPKPKPEPRFTEILDIKKYSDEQKPELDDDLNKLLNMNENILPNRVGSLPELP